MARLGLIAAALVFFAFPLVYGQAPAKPTTGFTAEELAVIQNIELLLDLEILNDLELTQNIDLLLIDLDSEEFEPIESEGNGNEQNNE